MNWLHVLYILFVVVILCVYKWLTRAYKLNGDGRCPICNHYIFRKSRVQDTQGQWWCRSCEHEFDSIDRG